MELLTFSPIVLIAGMLVGISASLVGSFLLLRRLTLVSDSLPHIALPGIALGYLAGFNPILGALAFLLLAVIALWAIEFKTKLEVDSITGVLFVTALAVGSLLVDEHELLESFFGNISNVGTVEAGILSATALVIFAAVLFLRKRLVLHSIAPDLARGMGIKREVTEIIFLGLVALTIATGISFVGVLLMSALLIMPAVTARLVAGESLTRYQIFSVVIGFLSITIGILFSGSTGIPVGVLTVLTGATFFLVALIASLF